MIRPTAKEFLAGFIDSYRENCDLYKEHPAKWEAVWNDYHKWDGFMLWKTGQPDMITASVLAKTADKLGLSYYEGQPFNLDGAFYNPKEWRPLRRFPFPIVVGFEHETNHHGFDDEISKLLSVRCPLKVGITYTLLHGAENTPEERQLALRNVCTTIRENFARISQLVGEDPASEYLFLVGTEEVRYSLRWHAEHFTAAQIPNDLSFFPVT